jgi:hypothetical protein
MPDDIDVVETLWGSLAHQMVEAAQRYLDAGAWRGETYTAVVRHRVGRWSVPLAEQRPHTRQTARAAFYRGFVQRIGARLEQARAAALHEVHADEPMDAAAAAPSGAALVLRAKHEEVQDFYREQSAARGSWGGYRGAAAGDNGSATGAGRAAAARARLGPAKGVGSGAPALPTGDG